VPTRQQKTQLGLLLEHRFLPVRFQPQDETEPADTIIKFLLENPPRRVARAARMVAQSDSVPEQQHLAEDSNESLALLLSMLPETRQEQKEKTGIDHLLF